MHQPSFVRPLTPAEKEGLKRFSESGSREESCRASVILLSAEGKTAQDISQQLGYHPTNVKKWIKRFNAEGLGGIAVKKRGPQGGPRPKFTQPQIEQILRLASAPPSSLGYGFKSWTPQKLATAAMQRGIVDRISHVTMRQILKRREEAQGSAPSNGSSHAARPEPARASADEPSLKQGEAALARSRYEEATEHLYSVLGSGTDSPEEEAVTRVLLSKALEELSKYQEAYSVIGKYEDSRALAPLTPRTRARVKLRIGWVNSFLGEHPKAIASLNESKRLFFELGDELGLSEAHYGLGRTYIELNEFRIARDLLVAAVSIQKTSLDRELLAQIYRRLGTVDYREGAFSSAVECYLKALELAKASQNTNLIGGLYVDLGTSLFGGGPEERKQGLQYMREGISFLERGGHKDYLSLACNNLGDMLHECGLWEEAIASLNKGIDVARRFSKPNHEAIARTTLAAVLCGQGKFTQAEEHLNKALALIEGQGDKWLESNIYRTLAGVYKETGRADAALKTLRQTMQLSTTVGDLYGLTLAMARLGEFYIWQGKLDQATEYLELAQGRLKEDMYLPESGLIQRLTGRVEAATGRLVEAKQHIAQSISIFTTTEIPYELAKSYYEMGLLLKQARDLSGAESNLSQAERIFEQLGAEPDLDLTRKALDSVALGVEGPQALRVSPANDALLMQRLIEASATRDLLVQELASVVYENFAVEGVVICRADDAGRVEVLAAQGLTRADADYLCASVDFSAVEGVAKVNQGYVLRISDNMRQPISIYVKPRDALDLARLQPLLRQAEFGLEACSLRAAARGATTRKIEQRIQTIMPGFIVGSPSMFDVIDKIYKIRTSDVTVLITGESGTGKELVARHIHAQSARARAIFLPFNCTATPKDIIDSQLFGHRRGAFTGATTNYPGIIKAADGGTLFLDEIGDLSLEVQPKLMRFLQEGEIQPLGETIPVRVDVRILAATNTDLERAVEDGRFREDLFHRLNIIRIHVPPLRERREEIPVLAGHFLEHFASRSGKQGVTMSQEAVDALTKYDWPGNVRQLRNEIERVVAYAMDGSRISSEDLSPEVVQPRRSAQVVRPRDGGERPYSYGLSSNGRYGLGSNGPGHKPGEGNGCVKLKDATAALERQLIEEALARNRNNLSRTATELGLSRRGLRLKLGQLGIHREERV